MYLSTYLHTHTHVKKYLLKTNMLFNNVIYLPNKTTMQIFTCKSELSRWAVSEKSEINQA